ncbi:MAG: hypothetical protein LBE20_04000 [Deltaproteobacteria bacterium]|jgi:hypothetical protein|nr:hypothetical protein [Deltaproteobacteria bacterium]
MSEIEQKTNPQLTAENKTANGNSLELPKVGQNQIQLSNSAMLKNIENVIDVANIQKIQAQQMNIQQTDLNNANLVYASNLEQKGLLDGVNQGNLHKKYFAEKLVPYISKATQRKFAGIEEDEDEKIEEERGDLFAMEIKNHLAQLKTPGLEGGSQKNTTNKIKGGCRQNTVSSRNIPALMYDKLVSMLHVFPWFFNFIRGIVLLRTTKQD